MLQNHCPSAFFYYITMWIENLLLGLLCPEDGSSIFRQNVGNRLPEHMVSKSNDRDLNVLILLMKTLVLTHN